MSDYLEVEIIKTIFRTGTITKPSVLAIALCTAAPTDASTGATLPEVANSNAYVRQALNPSDSNWAATSGSNGTTSNSTTITFPQASGAWGTVTHIAVVDSTSYSSGNVLFWGSIGSSRTVNSGDTVQISAGSLVVTVD